MAALPVSGGASGSGGGDGGDRRQPDNLQGLLKFCIENTTSEDAPGQAEAAGLMSDATLPSSCSSDSDYSSRNWEPGYKNTQTRLSRDHTNQGSGASQPMPNSQLARINQDKALSALGLYRYKIPGDGNCLFRAVASQLKLDQEKHHSLLRKAAVSWMKEHGEDLLAGGLLDNMDEISETAMIGYWPGQAAIVSLANILGVNIAVIQGGDKGDIDIQHIAPFEAAAESDQGSVILAYLYDGHYDAIVDKAGLPNPEYAAWLEQRERDFEASEALAKKLSKEPYTPHIARVHSPDEGLGHEDLDLMEDQETIPYITPPLDNGGPPHPSHHHSVEDNYTASGRREKEPSGHRSSHGASSVASSVYDAHDTYSKKEQVLGTNQSLGRDSCGSDSVSSSMHGDCAASGRREQGCSTKEALGRSSQAAKPSSPYHQDSYIPYTTQVQSPIEKVPMEYNITRGSMPLSGDTRVHNPVQKVPREYRITSGSQHPSRETRTHLTDTMSGTGRQQPLK